MYGKCTRKASERIEFTLEDAEVWIAQRNKKRAEKRRAKRKQAH
jgi:hypothetical protein